MEVIHNSIFCNKIDICISTGLLFCFKQVYRSLKNIFTTKISSNSFECFTKCRYCKARDHFNFILLWH